MSRPSKIRRLDKDMLGVPHLVQPLSSPGTRPRFRVIQQDGKEVPPSFQEVWQKPLMVAADNKVNLDSPLSVEPFDAASVTDYYRRNPITGHTIPSSSQPRMMFTGENGKEEVLSAVTTLAECRLISLKEVRCPRRHLGRYLLCRVLTEAKARIGLTMFVSGEEGSALPLHIAHPFAGPSIFKDQKSVMAAFPVNTILAIRDPYVHYGLNDDPEILVGSPADLVEQPLTQKLAVRFGLNAPVANPKVMRAIADRAKEQGKLEFALRYYDMILNSFDGCDATSLPNLRVARAIALADLGRYGGAYRDCLEVENAISVHEASDSEDIKRNIALIKLRSAYGLRLYSTASRLLRDCTELQVDAGKLDWYRTSLEARRSESQGTFDWPAIRRSIKLGQKLELADFVGPVKIAKRPGRGRVLLVTHPVKAGEILLVEKAFLNPNVQDYPHLRIHTGSRKGEIFDVTETTIATGHALQAAQDDPSVVSALKHLMPDCDSRDLVYSDEDRLAKIIKPSESIDVGLVGRKFLMNGFRDEGTDYSVFRFVSMINHSCLPNTVKHSQSGHFILQAKTDMPAGEEVTISYISPLPGLEERQAGFERTWEFECDCELCRADAVDDYVTRERMMDEEWPGLAKIASTAVQAVGLKGLNGSGKKSKSSQSAASAKVVKALKDFANRLVGTYGKTRRIKLELATVYGLLANLSREDRPVCVKFGVDSLLKRGVELATIQEAEKTGEAIKKFGHMTTDEADDVLRVIRVVGDAVTASSVVDVDLSNNAQYWHRSAWRWFIIHKGPMATREEFGALYGPCELGTS